MKPWFKHPLIAKFCFWSLEVLCANKCDGMIIYFRDWFMSYNFNHLSTLQQRSSTLSANLPTCRFRAEAHVVGKWQSNKKLYSSNLLGVQKFLTPHFRGDLGKDGITPAKATSHINYEVPHKFFQISLANYAS